MINVITKSKKQELLEWLVTNYLFYKKVSEY